MPARSVKLRHVVLPFIISREKFHINVNENICNKLLLFLVRFSLIFPQNPETVESSRKLGMIYTILGSSDSFLNCEGVDIRPQIRSRKIPVVHASSEGSGESAHIWRVWRYLDWRYLF